MARRRESGIGKVAVAEIAEYFRWDCFAVQSEPMSHLGDESGSCFRSACCFCRLRGGIGNKRRGADNEAKHGKSRHAIWESRLRAAAF